MSKPDMCERVNVWCLHMYPCVGDSSFSKVLVTQHENTSSAPHHPCQKLGVVAHTCKPGTNEAETGGLWRPVGQYA